MNLILDLVSLARFFTELKLSCVLLFLILFASLKNLRLAYFVATLASCFEVQQLLSISSIMLFTVLTISKLNTGLIVLGYEARDIFRIVYLLCIKCVELFAVHFCVGKVHILRCCIIVTTLFIDLEILGYEAMILYSG